MCKNRSFSLAIIGLLLTAIFSFGMIFVGCGDDSQNKVKLSQRKIQIAEFETFTLTVDVAVELEGESVIWSSSDESICTVKDGVITAVKIGTADVVAEVGGIKDTCAVTVAKQDKLAVINLSQKDVIVRVGQEVGVNALLKYNGNTVPASIEWKSEDESIATVSNGRITGVKEGSTTIVVSAVYHEEFIYANVSVTVKEDVVLDFGDTLINLKANSVIDAGKTEYSFAPKVKYKGAEVPAEYEYESADSNIVSITAGKASAERAGEVNITVKAKITGDSAIAGKTYSEKIKFVVSRSELDIPAYVTPFEVYSGMDGDVPVVNDYAIDLSAYGIKAESGETTVKLISGETEKEVGASSITVSGNGETVYVKGDGFGNSIYGDVSIELFTRTVSARIENQAVITKYIENEADLANMPIYGGIDRTTSEKAYNGYFALKKNVSLAGYPVLKNRGIWSWYSHNTNYDGTWGFQGVFDGQGYTISNLFAFGNFGGVFGNVGINAIVKNLGLKGELRPTESGDNKFTPFVLAFNFLGTLQNSYIEISVGASANYVCKAYYPLAYSLAYAKLNEVVIKFDAENMPNGSGAGYIGGQLGRYSGKWGNRTEFFRTVVFYKGQDCEAGSYFLDGDTRYPYEEISGIRKYGYTEAATVSMSDPTYWNTKDGQPVFKSAYLVEQNINYTGSKYQSTATAFETYSGISETTPSANIFSVDLSSYGIPAELNRLTVVGERKSKTLDVSSFNNGVLTVDGNEIGADIYGDVEFKFETYDTIYTLSSFKVITKKLSSRGDIHNMKFYGGIEANKGTAQKNYDGYFVMTNNIAMQYFNLWPNDYFAYNNVANNSDYGFTGIFEGNGYTISGLWVAFDSGFSLFGNVADSGVVRNLAIKDFTYRPTAVGGRLGVLGFNFNGTLENVYMEIAIDTGNQGNEVRKPLACSLAKAKLKDVVIKFDTTNLGGKTATYLADQIGIFGGDSWYNMATAENVHVFADNVTQIDVYNHTFASGFTAHGYSDSATVTMTDNTYWDMTGSQPAWKGHS